MDSNSSESILSSMYEESGTEYLSSTEESYTVDVYSTIESIVSVVYHFLFIGFPPRPYGGGVNALKRTDTLQLNDMQSVQFICLFVFIHID